MHWQCHYNAWHVCDENIFTNLLLKRRQTIKRTRHLTVDCTYNRQLYSQVVSLGTGTATFRLLRVNVRTVAANGERMAGCGQHKRHCTIESKSSWAEGIERCLLSDRSRHAVSNGTALTELSLTELRISPHVVPCPSPETHHIDLFTTSTNAPRNPGTTPTTRTQQLLQLNYMKIHLLSVEMHSATVAGPGRFVL